MVLIEDPLAYFHLHGGCGGRSGGPGIYLGSRAERNRGNWNLLKRPQARAEIIFVSLALSRKVWGTEQKSRELPGHSGRAQPRFMVLIEDPLAYLHLLGGCRGRSGGPGKYMGTRAERNRGSWY